MSINISASLLVDFLSCQRKPMYRIQLPETGIPTKEMFIGSAVHNAIEKSSRGKEAVSSDLTLSLEIRALDQADIAYADLCLDNFFTHFLPVLTDTDLIETRFKLPLDKNVFVVGRIDRISKDRIFDWKTTRNPPTKLYNDLQFIMYEWAFKRLYNKAPKGSYYGALATGTLIKHNKTEEAESYIFDELVPQVIYNIKNDIYPHTGVFSRSCYRCPYRGVCLSESKNVLDSGTFT